MFIKCYNMPSSPIYIAIKIFNKVPYIGNKLSKIWESFFFNSPIRTLTEVYIEMSFCFFLNTLNINFSSTSGIIATLFLFAFGLLIIFWPFIILSIMCQNPKFVKTHNFDRKYGTLIEEVNVKGTLYQRCYYPVFVYGRLITTASLVMLYFYPEIQMVVVLIFQCFIKPENSLEIKELTLKSYSDYYVACSNSCAHWRISCFHSPISVIHVLIIVLGVITLEPQLYAYVHPPLSSLFNFALRMPLAIL